MALVAQYATGEISINKKYYLLFVFEIGENTLRCLALATVDNPRNPKDMDLTDSDNFVKYEVDDDEYSSSLSSLSLYSRVT